MSEHGMYALDLHCCHAVYCQTIWWEICYPFDGRVYYVRVRPSLLPWLSSGSTKPGLIYLRAAVTGCRVQGLGFEHPFRPGLGVFYELSPVDGFVRVGDQLVVALLMLGDRRLKKAGVKV